MTVNGINGIWRKLGVIVSLCFLVLTLLGTAFGVFGVYYKVEYMSRDIVALRTKTETLAERQIEMTRNIQAIESRLERLENAN